MLFKDLYARFDAVKMKSLREKTASYIHHYMNNDVLPAFGDTECEKINPIDITAMCLAIVDKGHTNKAKRVRARCDQIFRFGVASGLCSDNPAAYVAEAMPRHKEVGFPALHGQEFVTFLHAVEEHGRMSEIVSDAWKLLLYTAKRGQEVIYATREEFDLKNARWIIPAHRMKMDKEHICPLSTQAVEIVARRIELGDKNLFPSTHKKCDFINRWAINYAVRLSGYQRKMTVHGVRKTFSSHAHESNKWSLDSIELQLAHAIPGIRGIYNQSRYMSERHKLVQWWSDEVDDFYEI